MEAIILAGGFGTRLKSVVDDIPKSMALVNGHPFLEYLLNYLTGQGIHKVIFSVGYKNEQIRDYFKDHYKGMQICYAIEDEPLGTGGGIKNAFMQVDGDLAYTMNGDSLFRLDFSAMHKLHTTSVADITIALRYFTETDRYGTVKIDDNRKITGFIEKIEGLGGGYINGGVYLINRSFFEKQDFPQKFSIEKDCFEKFCKEARIFGYLSRGYFLDIGIPEDYQKAQDDFKRFED
ncbi:MAG: nucleotidyltransferase family protein [Bacteroidetes bacterium]|nr:nucleotidyltransferase family protein [Bacteroidota bacterium]